MNELLIQFAQEVQDEEFCALYSDLQIDNAGKTINMPVADNQMRVVVIEPSNFDDSQKIADYLQKMVNKNG